MTQSQQSNESIPGMRDILGIGPARVEAMTQAHTELLKQLEVMQQGWLSRAKGAAESAADLVARCAKCSNAGEIAGFYNEWLLKRIEAFFADNRHFADQWLALVDAAMAPLKAAQAETGSKATESAPAAEPVAEPTGRSRAARA